MLDHASSRTGFRRIALTVLLVLLAQGCMPEAKAPTFPQKLLVAAAPPACEVRLDVSTDDRNLTAMDPKDGKRGTCIKWEGRALEIPQGITLTSGSLGRYTAGFLKNVTTLCVDDPEGNRCLWNGVYRQKFPMSFELRAEIPGKPLSDYVSLVLVYHNGTKVFGWDDTSNAHRIVIPSRALFTGKEPYDTPIDLHVVPSGVEVDLVALEAGLVQARRPWAEQVAGAALETLESDLLAGSELEKALQCFRAQIAALSSRATALIQGPGAAGEAPLPLPDGCAAPVLADPGIAQAYARLKADSYAEAERTKEELLEKLEGVSVGASTFVDNSLKKLVADYKAWKATQTAALTAARQKAGALEGTKPAPAELAEAYGAVANLEAAIVEGDRLVAQAAAVADKAVQTALAGEKVVRDALKEAVKLSRDSKKQAELFNAFTARLEQAGGPFDPRRENPRPAEGTSVLPMKYRDVLQTYAFGPWHGVPYRMQQQNELKVAPTSVIPVLDVLGVRWQFGVERMKEFRLAVGCLYYSDDRLEPEADGSTKEVEAQRFGVQANASVFGFRIGFLAPVDGFDELDQEYRLLLGADLYKLISGDNLEAL